MRRALTTLQVVAAITLGLFTLAGLAAAPNAGAATPSVTPTTVVPLGQLPTAPSTVPLTTKPPSAHVNRIFPELSGVGFAVVLLMLVVQWVLTRPGRRGRTL